MNLLQQKTQSAALFADVPLHQLLEVDYTKMSEAERRALVEHLTQISHTPAARRAVVKKESKAISTKGKYEHTAEAFSHLL